MHCEIPTLRERGQGAAATPRTIDAHLPFNEAGVVSITITISPRSLAVISDAFVQNR